jgi:hypothetical protein
MFGKEGFVRRDVEAVVTPTLLRTEVLEQGIEGEFLLDAEIKVPHGGSEFRIPRRRGRVSGEAAKRR